MPQIIVRRAAEYPEVLDALRCGCAGWRLEPPLPMRVLEPESGSGV
jgi:hypothetical protein